MTRKFPQISLISGPKIQLNHNLKKVEAIHNMAAPKIRQKLRNFPWFSQLLQGVVARRSDISASLTRLTSTKYLSNGLRYKMRPFIN